MNKICILTSIHHRRDTRIFIKEIPCLIKSGFEVSVIVADGEGNTNDYGYDLFDVGFKGKRLFRFFLVPLKMVRKALSINADIYHFHDPDLIPVGLKLLKRGKRVIYDVHEDVPRDILSKEWIIKPFRRIISFCFEYYENYASKHFSYIITSTPFIRDRFLSFCNRVIDINNYPLLGELDKSVDWEEKEQTVCYIGNITRARGVSSVIEAMQYVKGNLFLAGTFDYDSYRTELKRSNGWSKVIEVGQVNRIEAKEILAKSVAGLAVFLAEPNHINSQPNKIFEYMSAGIPVIASNFDMWKLIVEDNGCGICVDPMNLHQIADAINYLLSNHTIAKEMGIRGINAVKNHYNWSTEGKKLIDIYISLGS
jgi:glycosyltransferase involved in cell wall biosynthesis